MAHYNYNPLRATLFSLTLFSLTFGLDVQIIHAQTKIGGTAGPGDASAVLELQSTSQGLLPPRMTTAQRNAISNPAEGLMIYNTDEHCADIYKGSTNGWQSTCGAGAFTITNCGSASVTGTVSIGSTPSATVTLNYTNNTGQDYGPFTGNTANGITWTAVGAPNVSLANGNGNITLSLSGTPTASGTVNIPVTLAGAGCNIPVNVAGCNDPVAVGATGCVAFTYRGATVVYTTVKAKDNHIWLQQSLGAGQVATAFNDANAYGDYFQWGRWDDGHQVSTSTTTGTQPSPNDPSGVPNSNNNPFYTNAWWQTSGNFLCCGGNTWSGNTATATNGKDPCAALGAGWHIPSGTDYVAVGTAESITDLNSAFASNLKIAAGGYRNFSGGGLTKQGTAFYLWNSTTSGTSGNSGVGWSRYDGGLNLNDLNNRGYGAPVRCMK